MIYHRKRTVGPIIASSVNIRPVHVDQDRLSTFSKLNVWNFTLVASRLIKLYTPIYYAIVCRWGTQDLRNSVKSSTSLSFNIRVKLLGFYCNCSINDEKMRHQPYFWKCVRPGPTFAEPWGKFCHGLRCTTPCRAVASPERHGSEL